MIRLLTRAALVLSSLASTPALAQTSGADGANPPIALERPALRVVVDAAKAGLDSYTVQRAIESELGVIVHGDEHPNVVGTLRVVATGPDALTMEYTGNDGRRNSRTVGLPAEAAKRIETVALVAGNLARDETGQLIEELRPPEPLVDSAAALPPKAAPEPTPAAAPASAPAANVEAKQSPPEPVAKSAAEPSAPELEYEPVNLAVFSPIALYPSAPELEFSGQLGLFYSDVGRVRGGSVTGLAARVRYGFQGAQVSGLANFTDGASQGASIAGAVQVLRGDLAGASVSGIGTYSEGSLAGAEVAGWLSLRRGNASGVQVSGLVNFAHEVSGVQLAGGANLARGECSGAQVSGIGNLARSASGLMLTGGLNLVTETLTGAQVSTMNVAQSVEGIQIGLVNVARRVHGLQLGLVNVAEEVDGASVGLLPIAGNGYQRFVTWTTPGVASVSAGAKLGVGPLYTLLGVGYDQVDGGDRVVSSVGLGLQWEWRRLQLSLDALAHNSHVTNGGDVSDEGDVGDEGDQELFVSLRPLVGFRLQPWLRVFGGPAVVSGPHDTDWNRDLKLRAVAGIEVL